MNWEKLYSAVTESTEATRILHNEKIVGLIHALIPKEDHCAQLQYQWCIFEIKINRKEVEIIQAEQPNFRDLDKATNSVMLEWEDIGFQYFLEKLISDWYRFVVTRRQELSEIGNSEWTIVNNGVVVKEFTTAQEIREYLK